MVAYMVCFIKLYNICVSLLGFVGLAQYSGDPRIEWHLNAFSTKDAVIDAVKNLPYKGGNTLTGDSLILQVFGCLCIFRPDIACLLFRPCSDLHPGELL